VRRRVALAGVLAGLAVPAFAQAPGRPRRIGVLIDGSPPHPLPEALRAGMTERGWPEAAIAFEIRYANGEPARGVMCTL